MWPVFVFPSNYLHYECLGKNTITMPLALLWKTINQCDRNENSMFTTSCPVEGYV